MSTDGSESHLNGANLRRRARPRLLRSPGLALWLATAAWNFGAWVVAHSLGFEPGKEHWLVTGVAFSLAIATAAAAGVRLRGVTARWYRPRVVNRAGTSVLEIRRQGLGSLLLRLPLDTLAGADLTERSFKLADLLNADLRRAQLSCADLRGALLWNADFRAANLQGAKLTGASLYYADFRGADLRGANFRCWGWLDARTTNGLGTANLSGALYDQTTRWPVGFSPERHGAQLVDTHG